jgi:hypothetical protein
VKYENTETYLIIKSKYPADLIVNEYFSKFHNDGFHFDDTNTCKIEILFNKETLESIRLIKIIDFVSKDFLTLNFNQDAWTVIKYPYQKLALKKVFILSNQFICDTENEQIIWEISLPQKAIDFIAKLILPNII